MHDRAATSPVIDIRHTVSGKVTGQATITRPQALSTTSSSFTSRFRVFLLHHLDLNVLRLTEHSSSIIYIKPLLIGQLVLHVGQSQPRDFHLISIVPDHRSNGYLGISSITCRPVEAGRRDGIGKFPAFLSRNNHSNFRSLGSLNGCLLLFRSL